MKNNCSNGTANATLAMSMLMSEGPLAKRQSARNFWE